MADRKIDDGVAVIHPRALKALGLEASLVMLGVARDLRSGAIRAEQYDQSVWMRSGPLCRTACCIAGHTALRLGLVQTRPVLEIGDWAMLLAFKDGALTRLFGTDHPSDPQRAADAIENYVLRGADWPWGRVQA